MNPSKCHILCEIFIFCHLSHYKGNSIYEKVLSVTLGTGLYIVKLRIVGLQAQIKSIIYFHLKYKVDSHILDVGFTDKKLGKRNLVLPKNFLQSLPTCAFLSNALIP